MSTGNTKTACSYLYNILTIRTKTVTSLDISTQLCPLTHRWTLASLAFPAWARAAVFFTAANPTTDTLMPCEQRGIYVLMYNHTSSLLPPPPLQTRWCPVNKEVYMYWCTTVHRPYCRHPHYRHVDALWTKRYICTDVQPYIFLIAATSSKDKLMPCVPMCVCVCVLSL